MHIDVENKSKEQVPEQQVPEEGQNGGQQKKVHPVKSSEAGSAGQKFNRVKYKIDWKRLGMLLGGIALLVGLVFGGIWLFKNFIQDDPVKLFDVAVNLDDQTANNPETEKIKLKAGDVVSVRESGENWSATEKAQYLILKMKIKQSEADMLMEPNVEEFSEREAVKKGIASKEELDNLSREERKEFLTWSMGARKYRIKIEELEFDRAKLSEQQLFKEKEFGWEIVERK